MTSSRPYLFRAIYDWILDNQLSPYMLVDAMRDGVEVPERFVENGKIILNISPQAIEQLSQDNEAIAFEAGFSGIRHHIYVPMYAIRAIYAVENGRGMVFEEELFGDQVKGTGQTQSDQTITAPPEHKIPQPEPKSADRINGQARHPLRKKGVNKKPELRIVK